MEGLATVGSLDIPQLTEKSASMRTEVKTKQRFANMGTSKCGVSIKTVYPIIETESTRRY